MKQNLRITTIFSVMVALMSLGGCTGKKALLGTKENPIKLYFVPSLDGGAIADNAKTLQDYLEKNTPYKYSISLQQSFVPVMEAFATKSADVAGINTYAYLLAHEKYGAEARLTLLRHGLATYRSQFLVRKNSQIKSLADLAGKKIAFVDPTSISGYLLPLETLKEKHIQPKATVFAMSQEAVVAMIYQGQADAGATFYSEPFEGKIDDARRFVLARYPDVEKKVKILGLSEPLPNDPIVFRKDIPEEMKAKIAEALMAFIATPAGQTTFERTFGATALKKSTDGDYDEARQLLKSVGKSALESKDKE